MTLVNRFTLWHLALTAFVLLCSGIFIFFNARDTINKEEADRLKDWIEHLAQSIEQGVPYQTLNTHQIAIKKLADNAPLIPFHVYDTLAMHPQFERMERHLKAVASDTINGEHYAFAVQIDILVQPNVIAQNIIRSIGLSFIILLVLEALVGRLISARILSPFHKTLQVIQSFNLKYKNPLQLPATRIKEFQALHHFLEKTGDLARKEYHSLKEFTENASHELQTPLAIIRGKLELLMDSDIKDDQARLIMEAHQAVTKLSKINQSLTLLTRLENHDYGTMPPVNFSRLVCDTIAAFEELTAMKSITWEKKIKENVMLPLHRQLADILLNNLLSNAIRHNYANGEIYVELISSKLLIKNTGSTPDVPTEELFQRFKKSNQSINSVGLGLPIAKQICNLFHFSLVYTFEEPWHLLEVHFYPKK